MLNLSNLSPVLAYVSVALAPSIVRPAPLAAAASAAFLANVIFLSVNMLVNLEQMQCEITELKL